MRKTKIAVFGAGAWGRNIVRTLGELSHLAAVCDPSGACLEAARKLVGEKAKDACWTSRPEEILDDPEIAGVMVATPAETHYAVGKKVLAAGKDLFVEKPLTVDLKEGEKLVKAAWSRLKTSNPFRPSVLGVSRVRDRKSVV